MTDEEAARRSVTGEPTSILAIRVHDKSRSKMIGILYLVSDDVHRFGKTDAEQIEICIDLHDSFETHLSDSVCAVVKMH
jgi:hypothetical protein